MKQTRHIKPLRSPLLAAALLALAAAPAAQAREVIQIAGSSTVLPFASIVAEEFGQAFVQFRPPVVASGGSSGGLRQFCQGVGDNTIDIANSSRPIKPAEVADCAKAGVRQILQVKIGYDGIVFASRSDRARFALTPQQVFAAAAEQIERDGKQVKNPYTRWSQIDASLPDQPIVLVIPAANHGTREVFEEKVIVPGCNTYPLFNALQGDANKAACTRLRQDGRIIEIAGDYTETLARLQAQPEAVGVFGLSFYEQNRDRLVVATVNGVTPSLETVLDGSYPVSRPLYVYVKGEHIGAVPGLAQYIEYFISDAVSGSDSPLDAAGLIPLSDAERAQVSADFKARKAVK